MKNGAAFPTGDTVHGDGDGSHSSASTSDITRALQVIYDSRSDNLTRQKASEYLDSLKNSTWAAQRGHSLACDKTQPAVVQHFGLSLLEHSVRHNWHHFSDGQALELRGWILSLSQGVSGDQPGYLRNKIAQLFVELAKKDWAISWFDMDASLLAFWDQDPTHRELVLTVLESLSEDVFIRDDSAAGLRGHDLHNAVVEIFTPASNVAGGQIKSRKHLRVNQDGWLLRISRFLSDTPPPPQQASDQADIKACTCKALACLRSAFAWIMGPAITYTSCMKSIFTTLMTSDPDIQKVRATERNRMCVSISSVPQRTG
jgi:exportin-5